MASDSRRERLIELHRAFGHPVVEVPTVPPDDRVRLRVKLVMEESLELVQACFEYCDDSRFQQIQDDLREVIEHYPVKVDLPLAADALEDIQVVCEGFNLELGIDSGPIAAEVHRTNMAKASGPVRADGKQGAAPEVEPAVVVEQVDRPVERARPIAMKIPIVVTTFDRQPPHVHDTLTSLFERDPTVTQVTLIVSELSAEFLGPWLTDDRVIVRCLPPDRVAELKSRPRKARTAICTSAALRESAGAVIVLQDDLNFADRWYQRTLELAATITDEQARSRSLVALYSPYKHEGGSRPLSPYTKKDFYGNQALYFGDEVRRHCIWALTQADTLPDDVVIRLAMEREPVLNLYALVPSLAQHVGKVTTVESGWFHTSPTFVDVPHEE